MKDTKEKLQKINIWHTKNILFCHGFLFCCGLIFGLVAPLKAADTLPSPTAFVTALEVADLNKATAWLDAGLPADFEGSRIGTGLQIGAWEGNIKLMTLFVARGADVNQQNKNGETALVLAAWRGHLPAIQWLVERGAKINAGKNKWAALHYAVFNGQHEVVDYLLAEGADINAQTANGSSAVMMAVYEGRQDMVKKLAEKGANLQIKNEEGENALDWAMRHERLSIARLLASPEEFQAAIGNPKEKWKTAKRSLPSTAALDELLAMRETLVSRGQSTNIIDRRIAAERVVIVREQFDRPQNNAPSVQLEITASRKDATQQKMQLIEATEGQQGMPLRAPRAVPKAKMPSKANVKGY